MAEDSKQLPSPDTGQPHKRQYHRPELVEYGPISKLTRSGGSTRTEATAPRMMTACL